VLARVRTDPQELDRPDAALALPRGFGRPLRGCRGELVWISRILGPGTRPLVLAAWTLGFGALGSMAWHGRSIRRWDYSPSTRRPESSSRPLRGCCAPGRNVPVRARRAAPSSQGTRTGGRNDLDRVRRDDRAGQAIATGLGDVDRESGSVPRRDAAREGASLADLDDAIDRASGRGARDDQGRDDCRDRGRARGPGPMSAALR